MTRLFTEHEKLADVPPARPGWVTLGLTKTGEINDFGTGRKMTLGERLLGKFTKFYHVDMSPQSKVLELSAISGTGRYKFPVRIEIDFKVSDASELIKVDDPVEKNLLAPMRRAIFPEAKVTAAEEYGMLESRLQSQLDPVRGGASSYDMFEVTAIAVDVQPPPDYTLISGELDDISNLPLRTAARLARGDKAGAENLSQADRFMRDKKYEDLDDYSVKLSKIKELLRQRGQLELEADGPVQPALLAQIDQKIEELGGVPPELLESDESKPKRRAPKDADDDFIGDAD